MTWLDGFKGTLVEHAPLAPLTWFRLGGPARWLLSPRDEAALCHVIARARDAGIPIKPLGRGANVLVGDDGFDGAVLRLDAPTFTRSQYDEGGVVAGGGVDLMSLSRECSRRGLTGLEALAGIPAMVGGAIRMNAGGRHGDISDTVETVTVVDASGGIRVQRLAECEFGYRRSNLAGKIVTSARLRLAPADPHRTLAHFRSIWKEKKDSQPLAEKSAGCVFKNPDGASAGAMIDESGLKGLSRGGASVSEAHANFIVTRAGASAEDVLALIDMVREGVARRFGVELETEIDIWAPRGAGVGG